VNEFQANRDFEKALCEYSGAPAAIAVDNCCNALFLCLRWFAQHKAPGTVAIPKATFIGVPYAIRAAGFIPVADPAFEQEHAFDNSYYLKGAYQIGQTGIYDSALHFTSGMYVYGTLQCLSFTGPFKHLKLGKAGAILLDNPEAEYWLRKASYCGRNYVSYHTDTFELSEGYNMYLHPTVAVMGVQLIKGIPQHNEPLNLPYPDWTAHTGLQWVATSTNNQPYAYRTTR
jgi:dTDP-4-amino-4,6-dideoxygalactose transaminase